MTGTHHEWWATRLFVFPAQAGIHLFFAYDYGSPHYGKSATADKWVRFVIFTFRPTGFVVITSSDSLSGDPEFFG